jgi:glycine cleavage system transcriptional repressor
MSHFVLTAIGRDRPGIVDGLAGFLRERGANLEDSRMAILGGEFAVMLLFSVSADRTAEIERELPRYAAQSSLTTVLHPTVSPAERGRGPAVPLRIEAVALDHPGIVHEVAHALAEKGVNIESLTTRVTQAPMSGSPLFEMTLEVSVPGAIRLADVRNELADIAVRLNLYLVVTPLAR